MIANTQTEARATFAMTLTAVDLDAIVRAHDHAAETYGEGERAQVGESARWIEGYERVAERAAQLPDTRLVYVADRESDIIALMLRAQDLGIGGVPLERLRLTVNFRSQGGLVRWVSAAFPAIFPLQSDATLGAVPFAPSEPWHAPLEDLPVNCLAVPAGDAQAEARVVAACVADGA